MNLLKKIAAFLGSLFFAITLIVCATLMVILGTILESYYDSHLVASQWIYGSSIFSLLLLLFFVNILFSALKRWPFKIKHIPFLTTHLGLLMIISGCMIKQWLGIQGHMTIIEGSHNHSIQIPQTYALHIEKNEGTKYLFPLSLTHPMPYKNPSFPDFQFKILSHIPHVQDHFDAWIKNHTLMLFGLPPIPVEDWTPNKLILNTRIVKINDIPINIVALRTTHVQDAIKAVYQKDLNIAITKKDGSNIANNKMQFNLDYSLLNKITKAVWTILWNKNAFELSLMGRNSLYMPYTASFNIDIKRERPCLLFIEDNKNCHLFLFDQYGRIQNDFFSSTELNNVMSYDQGFSGYSIQISLPLYLYGRTEKEKYDQLNLIQQLKDPLKNSSSLAPPLELFKKSCDQLHLATAESFVTFLVEWSRSYPTLTSTLPSNLKTVLEQLDWSVISIQDRKACEWITLLLDKIQVPYDEGIDVIAFLESNNWPFIQDLNSRIEKGTSLFVALAQQLFEFAPNLPTPPNKSFDNVKMFAAFLLAYGIEPTLIQPLVSSNDPEIEIDHLNVKNLHLETSLVYRHKPQECNSKLENNKPCIIIETKNKKKSQVLALPYTPFGEGLKWPSLDGQYLLRFQPNEITLPQTIRLKQARQINYPDSNQPYSYECDLIVYENNKIPLEVSLSMNNVFETWNGYRFYLAGITKFDSGLKGAQVVVNFDPAKYYLTYPGGIIACFGIILLFWMNPYKKKD